ncbi:MAG: MFS transporter [Gammaproteobacteria bacterium]|nr:MFS transporter [Gammaproteobacteria bacterium]
MIPLVKPSRASLYALSFLVFLISDVQGGVGPFITVYITSALNWDAEKIGLVLGMYNISSLVSQIPGGLLIDSAKYKQWLIGIATIIIAMGCLLIVNSSTLLPILIAQSFIGIATSIIPPAITAITLGLVGQQLFPERLAINATFNHAGNVFNAFITGLMVFWLGVSWVLYVDVFFSLISLIPLMLIKKSEINNAIARELPQDISDKNYKPLPIAQLMTSFPIIIFGISLILFTFSNSAQLPLLVQKIAAHSSKHTSFYMSSSIIIAQLVMIVVAFMLSFIINKIGRKPLFMSVYFILVVRAILYTLTTKPYLLIANQLLDGVAAGIFSIVSIVIISDLAKNSGRFNFMQGLMIFCISIGAALSNLVAGYVAKLMSIDVAFILLAGIAAIGLLFFGCLMPETKNKT